MLPGVTFYRSSEEGGEYDVMLAGHHTFETLLFQSGEMQLQHYIRLSSAVLAIRVESFDDCQALLKHQFPNIRPLYVDDSSRWMQPAFILPLFQSCPRLESLEFYLRTEAELDQHDTWSAFLEAIAAHRAVPQLLSLELDSEMCTDDTLQSLVGALPHLQRLQIGRCTSLTLQALTVLCLPLCGSLHHLVCLFRCSRFRPPRFCKRSAVR